MQGISSKYLHDFLEERRRYGHPSNLQFATFRRWHSVLQREAVAEDPVFRHGEILRVVVRFLVVREDVDVVAAAESKRFK